MYCIVQNALVGDRGSKIFNTACYTIEVLYVDGSKRSISIGDGVGGIYLSIFNLLA